MPLSVAATTHIDSAAARRRPSTGTAGLAALVGLLVVGLSTGCTAGGANRAVAGPASPAAASPAASSIATATPCPALPVTLTIHRTHASTQGAPVWTAELRIANPNDVPVDFEQLPSLTASTVDGPEAGHAGSPDDPHPVVPAHGDTTVTSTGTLDPDETGTVSYTIDGTERAIWDPTSTALQHCAPPSVTSR